MGFVDVLLKGFAEPVALPDEEGAFEDELDEEAVLEELELGFGGLDVEVGTGAGVVPLAVEPLSPFFVHVRPARNDVRVASSRFASAWALVSVMT